MLKKLGKIVLITVYIYFLIWSNILNITKDFFVGNMFAGIGSGEVMSGTVLTGDVETGEVMSGTVLTGDVETGEVMSGALLTGDVETGEVMGGAVMSGDVETGEVMSGTVLTGDVETGEVMSGAVMSGDVETGEVMSGALLTGDVETGEVMSGAVMSGDVETGEVMSGALLTGDVETGEIMSGTTKNNNGGSNNFIGSDFVVNTGITNAGITDTGNDQNDIQEKFDYCQNNIKITLYSNEILPGFENGIYSYAMFDEHECFLDKSSISNTGSFVYMMFDFEKFEKDVKVEKVSLGIEKISGLGKSISVRMVNDERFYEDITNSFSGDLKKNQFDIIELIKKRYLSSKKILDYDGLVKTGFEYIDFSEVGRKTIENILNNRLEHNGFVLYTQDLSFDLSLTGENALRMIVQYQTEDGEMGFMSLSGLNLIEEDNNEGLGNEGLRNEELRNEELRNEELGIGEGGIEEVGSGELGNEELRNEELGIGEGGIGEVEIKGNVKDNLVFSGSRYTGIMITGNIETNTGSVETNTGNIETNTGNIETNTGNIETNTGNIETNTGNAETNTGNAETNTGNAETNTGNADILGDKEQKLYYQDGFFDKGYYRNEKNYKVIVLKHLMKKLGYYDHKIDNKYNKKIIDSVYDFQIEKGIIKKGDKAGGFMGPATRNILNNILKEYKINFWEEQILTGSDTSSGFIKNLKIRKILKDRLLSVKFQTGTVAKVKEKIYTGKFDNLDFVEEDIAFELLDKRKISVLKIGDDKNKISLMDNKGITKYAEIEVQIEEKYISEDVGLYYSHDQKNWMFDKIIKPYLSGDKVFVKFDTNHFTYFALGVEEGSFFINDDDLITSSTGVVLTNNISGAVNMKFGNTTGELFASSWETYSGTKSWYLTTGDGTKQVYAMFQDGIGQTGIVLDTIILDTNNNLNVDYSSLPSVQGLTLWYDVFDQASIQTGTGNSVIKLFDKSLNGYDLEQYTTTNQPVFEASGIRNLPSMYFDGSDDYLPISDLNYNGVNSISGMFVCAVFKTPFAGGGNSNRAFLDFDRSDYFNFYAGGDGSIGFSYTAGSIIDNSTASTNYNDNNPHIACASYDNSKTNDTQIIVDGLVDFDQDRTTNGSFIGKSSTRYGFVGDGSEASDYDGSRNNAYYEGHIGEIIYYQRALSDDEKVELQCYLSDKWGIGLDFECDNEVIEAFVEYLPSGITSGNVLAFLTGYTETGIILNNSGSDQYIFENNGNFTFLIEDLSGNVSSVFAEVDWIDKIKPNAGIVYSKTGFTTGQVVATLTGFSETGITIINNNGSGIYVFDNNGFFTFEYVDLVGLTGETTAIVDWIDETNDDVYIIYDPNSSKTISGNVIATITGVSDLIIDNNSGNFEYIFDENGSFEFEYNYSGGAITGTKTAFVYWLDNTKPTASVVYSPDSGTNTFGSVIAKLTGFSENITITNNGGNEQFVFDSNGSFDFEYRDDVGNTGITSANVSWIQNTSVSLGMIVPKLAYNIEPMQWKTFNFDKTYSTAPLVFVTPKTYNNGDKYPMPLIRNVSTTSFEMTMCVDEGDVDCSTTANPEDFSYFVVDVDDVSSLSWIDVGTVNVASDGSDTNFSFNKTFANIPYVRTTTQTYSQGGNNGVVSWLDDGSLSVNGGDIIGCRHDVSVSNDDCQAGPSEIVAYLAIDVNNANITGFSYGSESISSSTWTTVNFGQSYSDARVMVSQDSDNGGQDPQYPWSYNIGSNYAEIRYCEQDGINDCDNHTSEEVVWFALEGEEPPEANVVYSKTGLTSGDVIATLTGESEPITIINNGGNRDYTFIDNGLFVFEIQDSKGNTNTVLAEVDWIDKDKPTAQVFYSTTGNTFGDVLATITGFSETGVVITNNGGTGEYLFTENGTFEFELIDLAGNTGVVLAEVDWIVGGAVEGEPLRDTCLDGYAGFEDYNYGVSDFGWIGPGGQAYTLLYFDLDLVDGAVITSGTITLTENNYGGGTFEIRQMLGNNSWIEGTKDGNTTATAGEPTYNRKEYNTVRWSNGSAGLVEGVDYGQYDLVNSPSILQNETKTFEFNQTGINILQELINDNTIYNGLVLADSDNWIQIGTKEQINANDRPIINLEYYIDNQKPTAYVEYIPNSGDYVSGNVLAILTGFSETGIVITNNSGSDQYTFFDSGSSVFEFEDRAGNTGEALAYVDWILPIQAPNIVLDTNIFVESVADDGSIGNDIIITLDGDNEFVNNISDYIITQNIPSGLSTGFVRDNDKQITFSLDGNATFNGNLDDVENVSIEILSGIFANPYTGTFEDGLFTGIEIDFIEINSISLNPVADTTLDADTDPANGCDDGRCQEANYGALPYGGWSNFGSVVLMRFDLSSIPVGSKIYAGSLRLTRYDIGNSGEEGRQFRIKKIINNSGWIEGMGNGGGAGADIALPGEPNYKQKKRQQANWYNNNPGLVEGLDYASVDLIDSSSFDTLGNETKVFDFNADGIKVLQDWFEIPSSNQGFGLVDAETGWVYIWMREAGTTANRPLLTVNYVEDVELPEIVSLSPLDNATGVSLNSKLIINFDENIQKISGNNIYIKRQIDDSVFETIDVGSNQVQINMKKATITPSSGLENNTGYYIQIDSGAFGDIAGNGFEGILNNTDWNFETVDALSSPIVIEPYATGVNQYTGIFGGNIISIGSANIVERGIYWSLDSGFNDGEGNKVSETGNWFSTGIFGINVDNLPVGEFIYFKAFAKNSFGANYSIQTGVLMKPADPIALSGKEISNKNFLADWTDSTGVSTYSLYVATNSGFTNPLIGYNPKTNITTSKALIENLNPETDYYYKVFATNSAGNSKISNISEVTTTLLPRAIMHLKLDETSGGIAYDSVSTHDGILEGTVVKDQTGIDNRAFYFDGIDDRVSVVDFGYGPDMVISFWFKKSGSNDNEYLLSHGDITDPNGINVIFNSTELGMYLNGQQLVQLTGTEYQDILNDEWHFYTLVIDDNYAALGKKKVWLYIDGQEKYASLPMNAGFFNPTTNIVFGRRGTNSAGTYWDGYLDDIKLYNQFLSASEVEELYNSFTLDKLPPSVKSTSPSSGEIDVLIDQDIEIEFTRPVDKPSILETGVISYSPNLTNPVYSWLDDETLVIGHDDFIYLTGYTITISTGVQDLSGQNMSGNYQFSFATQSNINIRYEPNIFLESSTNDGTISNYITIVLTGDNFTTGVASGGNILLSNLPDFLTGVFTRIDDNNIKLELTGSAVDNLDINDVDDLTIQFLDGAFVNNFATGVSNSMEDGLYIDFNDPAFTALFPIADTTLDDNNPDWNRGDSDYGFVGEGSYMILRFDIEDISAQSIINSATLTLTKLDRIGTQFQLGRFIQNPDWIEGSKIGSTATYGEPTFNEFGYNQTGWYGGGAGLITGVDFDPTPLIDNPSFSGNESRIFSLNSTGVAVVSGWLKNPDTNYGFVLYGGNGNMKVGMSEQSESSYQPKLLVNYNPDTVSPTAIVEYSPNSGDYLSGSVFATLTGFSEHNITILNNGGSPIYEFTGNGTFTFIFADPAGNTGSVIATVDWIYSVSPELKFTTDTSIIFGTALNISGSVQTLEKQFLTGLSVYDSLLSSTGWYTTVSISDLTGNYSSISNNNIYFRSSGLTLLTGNVNTGVSLNSGLSVYNVMTGVLTVIYKNSGVGVDIFSEYNTKPYLKVDVPAYQSPGNYQGVVTYTLYEE